MINCPLTPHHSPLTTYHSVRLWVIAVLILLVAAGSSLRAQTKSMDPPAAGRPADFSRVVGNYRISKFTAEPTEVIVEEPITVKIHITGKTPKEYQQYQPQRRFLRLFKEDIERDFYIEAVSDQDRVIPGKNGEQTWEFVYRFRPKSVRVKEMPDPKLVYFTGVKYNTSYPPNDEPIRLAVKPRPEFKPSDYGLRFYQPPEHLYQLAMGNTVLARDEAWPYWEKPVLVAAGLGIPLASWLGLLFWHWLYPDSLRQLQRRRSLAARRAVRELHHVRTSYTAPTLAKILTGYLSQRLDFPAVEPTPVEVTHFLRRRGVAPDIRQLWANLFNDLDEARYTPKLVNATPAHDSWPKRAANLIHALEADPCLSYKR